MALLDEMLPLGQVTDEGDTILQVRRLVKGRHPRFMLHDGSERDTKPADRVPNGAPAVPASGGVHMARDLAQDKGFTRTYSAVDEFGAPASVPFDGTMAFSTDRPDVLNVTDNGDGSAKIDAIGPQPVLPVVAMLTFTATPAAGGAPIVINDAIQVTAGAPEGFAATDSPDVEVTPDTPPGP